MPLAGWQRWAAAGAVTTLALALSGCGKCSSDAPSTPSPSPGPSGSAPAVAAPSAPLPGAPVPDNVARPSGPLLAIVAGKGLGPIRFGATPETVERLMQAPCDVRTPRVCRYIERAVEFFFDAEGTVERMHVHRAGRPTSDAAGKPRSYGLFHGAIPPDLKLLMLPWAIQQHLGKPASVEPVADGGAAFTAERHRYPGMLLEYDRLQNGNLVLSGVILEKSQP